MKVVTTSQEVFACYTRSCAPPPVGTGGSGGGKGIGRSLTQRYGVRQASGGSGRKLTSDNPSRKVGSRSQKAIDDWKKRSGKNQDDEKSTAKAMTAKYGVRSPKRRAKYENKERDEARKLTARYASR